MWLLLYPLAIALAFWWTLGPRKEPTSEEIIRDINRTMR